MNDKDINGTVEKLIGKAYSFFFKVKAYFWLLDNPELKTINGKYADSKVEKFGFFIKDDIDYTDDEGITVKEIWDHNSDILKKVIPVYKERLLIAIVVSLIILLLGIPVISTLSFLLAVQSLTLLFVIQFKFLNYIKKMDKASTSTKKKC